MAIHPQVVVAWQRVGGQMETATGCAVRIGAQCVLSQFAIVHINEPHARLPPLQGAAIIQSLYLIAHDHVVHLLARLVDGSVGKTSPLDR